MFPNEKKSHQNLFYKPSFAATYSSSLDTIGNVIAWIPALCEQKYLKIIIVTETIQFPVMCHGLSNQQTFSINFVNN